MNIVISRIVIELELKFSVLVSENAVEVLCGKKNAQMEYFLCLFSINSVIKMAVIPLFDLESFL